MSMQSGGDEDEKDGDSGNVVRLACNKTKNGRA